MKRDSFIFPVHTAVYAAGFILTFISITFFFVSSNLFFRCSKKGHEKGALNAPLSAAEPKLVVILLLVLLLVVLIILLVVLLCAVLAVLCAV